MSALGHSYSKGSSYSTSQSSGYMQQSSSSSSSGQQIGYGQQMTGMSSMGMTKTVGGFQQEEQSKLSESTGSLTVQRSSKGAIGFSSMDHSGGNIVIENTTSGARAKTQNLSGWRLVKVANGRNTVDMPLKNFDLGAGQSFTLWAKGAKGVANQANEQVCDQFSFGVGTCQWKLLDQDGSEKATLNAKFSG